MTHSPDFPLAASPADSVLAWRKDDADVTELSVTPSSFTLSFRPYADASSSGSLLLSLTSGADSFDLRVLSVIHDGERSIEIELRTGFREAPLRLRAPLECLGLDGDHSLTVRSYGHRIELIVDGVIVDEEWPVGLATASVPCVLHVGGEEANDGRISGLIESVAAWDYPLTDAEVAERAGGPEEVSRTDRKLLGEETPVGQNWKPRGFDTWVGDCMPFYDGDRYHLFYLFDRRGHASKWSLGAHQWAHASSPDLRRWEHHPMAIPVTDSGEGSICTGSVLHHDGTYHAFYTVRTVDGSPAPLRVSVSDDGVHFEKTEWRQTLPAPYHGPSARDPHVFRDPSDGRFHMLVTTSLTAPDAPMRGCLAHLISDDLRDWEPLDPFLTVDRRDEPECPEWFEWKGWYYLVFSLEGTARYRMSRSPLGLWETPPVDTFNGPVINVMKSAPYHGDRRIGAGFLRRPGQYGGVLIFREILQNPDGTLYTDWPPELPASTG